MAENIRQESKDENRRDFEREDMRKTGQTGGRDVNRSGGGRYDYPSKEVGGSKGSTDFKAGSDIKKEKDVGMDKGAAEIPEKNLQEGKDLSE